MHVRDLLIIASCLLLAACGREPSTLGPEDDAFGRDEEGLEEHPVVLGVIAVDNEPVPAQPGQRVAAAQVAVGDDHVELENADADHDGVLDDRELDPRPEAPPAQRPDQDLGPAEPPPTRSENRYPR